MYGETGREAFVKLDNQMNVLIFLLLVAIVLNGRYTIVNNKNIRIMPKKIAYWYFFCIIAILTCFRYNVGFDYPQYYNYLIDKDNKWPVENFELIPRFILIIARYLDAPWLFFTIIGFFILFFIFKTIEDFSYEVYPSLIIFLTLFYLTSLSSVRQWLAISIIFYSYRFIKRRKFLYFLLCVAVAGNCHTTAYLSILIYFIYNNVSSKIIIFLSLLTKIFSKKIINIILVLFDLGKYQSYIENTVLSGTGATKVNYVYYILIFFNLFLYFYLKIWKSSKEEEALISVTTFGVFFPSIFGTSTGLRISYYFYIFLILLEPFMIAHIKEKNIKYLFLFLFYFFYLLFLVIDMRNDQGYTKYIFYFFKENYYL